MLDLAAARAHLADADPAMAAHMARTGPPRMGARRGRRPHFEALARSITYQQLAGRAAASIWGRTRALVPGPFTPEAVLALEETALRGAGVSGAKAAAVHDLAARAADGRLRLGRIGALDDEAVIDHLVQVRGIGRWTAEMFLIFQLRRLDVWPVDDLGVRKGYGIAWQLGSMPSPKELAALGEPLRPYRSVAAWYCWRATELTDVLPA